MKNSYKHSGSISPKHQGMVQISNIQISSVVGSDQLILDHVRGKGISFLNILIFSIFSFITRKKLNHRLNSYITLISGFYALYLINSNGTFIVLQISTHHLQQHVMVIGH